MEGQWGHCMHCKHFGSPAEFPLDTEEAPCAQPQMAKVRLMVFGTNGCTWFELRPGLPHDVERTRHIETSV